MVCWFSSRSRTLKESLLLSRSSQSASRSSWRATGRTRLPSRAERVPWCWATQGSTWLRQWSPCERRNSNQTVSTSPGVSGPFQWGGAGKWRSRVAGRSRRCRVAHKTGRSATTSTRSKRGSVVFILPFYPAPPFPKTTPNTSEPPVLGSDCQMAVPATEGKWGWLLVSHPEHLDPVDLAEAIGIPQPEEEEEPQMKEEGT